jgi:hypothetical protein
MPSADAVSVIFEYLRKASDGFYERSQYSTGRRSGPETIGYRIIDGAYARGWRPALACSCGTKAASNVVLLAQCPVPGRGGSVQVPTWKGR